jgi:hypothetical protein
VRRELLSRGDEKQASFRVRPFRGGPTRPGVDLDDNALMLEIMDDDR